MENIKDFLSMSEEEKIRRIKSLDPKEVIRILTSVGTNALSAELLNQLAVAYNNSIQPEKAMETLDLVKEQERDAKWYYRYGYACAAISSRLQEKKFLYQWKALEMIEKAITGSKTQEVIDWCLEIMDLRSDLTELAKMNPSSFPRLSAYYLKAQPDNEGSEEKEKYKKVSAIEWIFNQKEYLPDAFARDFNMYMTKRYPDDWSEGMADEFVMEEPEILVTYEAWIRSPAQLHDNERLNEEDDLKEENKDNDMWQVEIMAHLKADNGKAFTLQELIFKLQNLMADKELGDHVFLEGMEYEGHECEGNGLIDDPDGIPVFYVCCGS